MEKNAVNEHLLQVAVVKRNEEAMNEACEKMGIPHPKLFVMMLLMQSYDKFMSDQMKKSEKMLEETGSSAEKTKESSWGDWEGGKHKEKWKDLPEEERKAKRKEMGKQWMDMFKVTMLWLSN